MSASRHLKDCTDEATRLALALQDARTGQPSDLDALHRSAQCVLYHAARAALDLARMPQQERRLDIHLPVLVPAAAPTLQDAWDAARVGL